MSPSTASATRRWAVAALIVGLLSGCARDPSPEPLAWWLEDVAHGIPRRPTELDGDPPLAPRLRTWLAGDVIDGDHQPPLLLRQRRERRAAIMAAFRRDELFLQDGEVGPSPRLNGARQRTAALLADNENLDRRQIDTLVISLGALTPAQAMRYRDAIHALRTRYDQEDGGTPWTTTR